MMCCVVWYVLFFIYFLFTNIYSSYSDMVRDGGCAHVEAGGWLQVAMSHTAS